MDLTTATSVTDAYVTWTAPRVVADREAEDVA
jgi:hypothetical protein